MTCCRTSMRGCPARGYPIGRRSTVATGRSCLHAAADRLLAQWFRLACARGGDKRLPPVPRPSGRYRGALYPRARQGIRPDAAAAVPRLAGICGWSFTSSFPCSPTRCAPAATLPRLSGHHVLAARLHSVSSDPGRSASASRKSRRSLPI